MITSVGHVGLMMQEMKKFFQILVRKPRARYKSAGLLENQQVTIGYNSVCVMLLKKGTLGEIQCSLLLHILKI
jgi:hypothetical protein